jgi:hypothetical protein
MQPSALQLLAPVLLSTAALAQQSASQGCLPSIADMALPGQCIGASTIPTPGALLPLGPELFVSPAGEVGIGTQAPQHRLDVNGDARFQTRLAVGNEATIGVVGLFDKAFDLSCRGTDFSAAPYWSALRSHAYVDPLVDLVGANETYVFSHFLIGRTPTTNARDLRYLAGPYLAAWHDGTGNIDYLNGALIGAEVAGGYTDSMSALFAVADARGNSSIGLNVGVEILTGHRGFAGDIAEDYGLYVYTPYADRPLQNHYGIFLEDQDVGVGDSYALYSEGGTSYLAGDLGVGTPTPAAQLHVAGDFAATGTKSFVAPHPDDAEREIWFVCLEGNEAGTYFRGNAALERGRARVPVPEEFRLVSEAEGLTVQLTPRGPGALWVESSSLDWIVVRGDADIAFDYLVNGVRRGYADFEVMRARPAAARPAGPLTPPAESRARLEARMRRPGE